MRNGGGLAVKTSIISGFSGGIIGADGGGGGVDDGHYLQYSLFFFIISSIN